jgi:uncharacterized membrane protein YfcA
LIADLQGWVGAACGFVVGLSLGLTGGGGSIFAVPLLIYAAGVPVRTAIGLSLAVVGLTAGFGAAMRLRAGEVDFRAGLVFAASGMVFAPAGSWLGGFVAAPLLLSVFALLMAFTGWRLWNGKDEGAGAVGPCVVRGDGKLGPGCYSRLSGAGAVAVAGLPAGVTATFTPTSIPTGSTTSTLTLAAAANATVGTAPITISASAPGVSTQEISSRSHDRRQRSRGGCMPDPLCDRVRVSRL